jgi:poly(3-hydroxyalkanoate) synthetase
MRRSEGDRVHPSRSRRRPCPPTRSAGAPLDALASSNFPWSNPSVIKESGPGRPQPGQGGRRFLRGFPCLPSTVDTSKFSVGNNLALTAGSVVLRTEVFELIQYAPQTEHLRDVPLLFAPPTINKYYVLDLAPGRSMVEWLVQRGQQVFVISWRNPDAEQGHFDLDTYAGAVLEARDAVAAIADQPAVHLNGVCAGGIISAGVLGHLAAEGRLGEIASRATESPSSTRSRPRRGPSASPRRTEAGGPTTTNGSPRAPVSSSPRLTKRLGGDDYKALAKAPGSYVKVN